METNKFTYLLTYLELSLILLLLYHYLVRYYLVTNSSLWRICHIDVRLFSLSFCISCRCL